MRRLKKKGSLELSINTIVIVVLALTLLGLGLAFIRGQIQNISGTTGAVQEQIKQQILDDLRTGNKPLSFPTNEISLQSKDQTNLAIGVKNTGDSTLRFKIIIKDLNMPAEGEEDISKESATACHGSDYDSSDSDNKGLLKSVSNQQGCFFWNENPQILPVGGAEVYPIKHFAKQTQDTYMYQITIMKDNQDDEGNWEDSFDEEYASKTFFVRVT